MSAVRIGGSRRRAELQRVRRRRVERTDRHGPHGASGIGTGVSTPVAGDQRNPTNGMACSTSGCS